MIGTRPVLCIAVMLLLGVACARGRCNYSAILSDYRQVIFVELQGLDLTGTLDTSKENSCPSNKMARIVRSIYRMTEQFVCPLEDHQEDRMATVVSRMGQLIKLHCRKRSLGNGPVAALCKTSRKKKKPMKQERRMKMIQMLIHCWQKLQSVYS